MEAVKVSLVEKVNNYYLFNPAGCHIISLLVVMLDSAVIKINQESIINSRINMLELLYKCLKQITWVSCYSSSIAYVIHIDVNSIDKV